jgi:hypothetical protein
MCMWTIIYFVVFALQVKIIHFVVFALQVSIKLKSLETKIMKGGMNWFRVKGGVDISGSYVLCAKN